MRAVVLVTLALLPACASLPPCPKFSVSVYPTQKGPVFVIDEANMLILAGRMQQIHDRACDPEAPEIETPKPAPKPAADHPAPSVEPWRHELKGA